MTVLVGWVASGSPVASTRLRAHQHHHPHDPRGAARRDVLRSDPSPALLLSSAPVRPMPSLSRIAERAPVTTLSVVRTTVHRGWRLLRPFQPFSLRVRGKIGVAVGVTLAISVAVAAAGLTQ